MVSFKPFPAIDEISRLKALALTEWIYFMFEKITERKCPTTSQQLRLNVRGVSAIEVVRYHGNNRIETGVELVKDTASAFCVVLLR